MSAFGANPFVYIFSAVVILAAVAYYAFGAIDRAGLQTQSAVATVVQKQYNPPGTTYTTERTGGRTYTRPLQTAETFAVVLKFGNEQTVGLVSRELFQALADGDTVRVQLRRTRVTHRLEAVEVRK
jgi:hypothetical protein